MTKDANEDNKLDAQIFAKFFFDNLVPPGSEFEREKRFALKDLIQRDDLMAESIFEVPRLFLSAELQPNKYQISKQTIIFD